MKKDAEAMRRKINALNLAEGDSIAVRRSSLNSVINQLL